MGGNRNRRALARRDREIDRRIARAATALHGALILARLNYLARHPANTDPTTERSRLEAIATLARAQSAVRQYADRADSGLANRLVHVLDPLRETLKAQR